MFTKEFNLEVRNFLTINKQKLTLFLVILIIIPFPVLITSSYSEVPFFIPLFIYSLLSLFLQSVPLGEVNFVSFMEYFIYSFLISGILSFIIVYCKEGMDRSIVKKVVLALAVLVVLYFVFTDLGHIWKCFSGPCFLGGAY